MKILTLEELKGKTEEEIVQHIIEDYEATIDEIDKFHILIACSDQGGYEESGFFLLREKVTGDLYINESYHCSCYGFEGQWEPELTNLEVLKNMNEFSGLTETDEQIKEYLRGENEQQTKT